ncbi:MAG TPA: glycoside hydrolase family 11 protein [Actinocrinis sp.]|uniref:glycoside hydrolase family 11 protein n=1 Tax=Actinocrinis sp. TaxID=1920516 RepID=UPI002DDCD2E5|nr:glycoside hydrolase family 11 protein [Actinocrinis sp.]HEV2345079.1 glycoside hydrolase family 11 protein [Actinocrinis sp.]
MDDASVRPKNRRSSRIRLLISGVTTAAVATVVAAAMTLMPTTANAATQICSNQTGNSGGNYYQMWSNGQGSACITLNSGTSYTSTWSGIGDFVAGVGWNPGSNHTISFSSTLSASGGTTLISLYGWSTNPLVEYYVEEDYNGSPNTAGTYMGQMTSDGGTYSIYEHQQVNQPSIQGTATFEQYLAIRTSPTSSGTITTQNFFNAWSSHGMNLGTMNYQILATEAWGGGSGNDNFTVSHSTGGGGGGSGSPLHAVGSGKCLDIPNSSTTLGTQLQIWDCSGQANQSWTHTSSNQLTATVNGTALCLDAYNNQTSPGTKVETWSCNGGANQQWNTNSNGTVTGAQSGLCLDVTGASTANGAQVELWTCNGGGNQQWKLG